MTANGSDTVLQIEPSAAIAPHTRLAIIAAFPAAVLVALVSTVGILVRSTYARETPNWAAQAVGQDWTDLLLAVPWLTASGAFALRGSRRALLLLGGGYFYTLYEFVIYGFAVHFNGLFLVYCGALGLAFFALAALAVQLVAVDVRSWYLSTPPSRAAGIFLTAVGVLFALLWLSEIIPALFQGATPLSVSQAGAATNPVHVIDLSVVLPR